MDGSTPRGEPDALDHFIETQVKAGVFASREAALADIKEKIAVGMEQVDRGEVVDGEELFRELLGGQSVRI